MDQTRYRYNFKKKRGEGGPNDYSNMLKLIDDLVDISKIEAGQFEIHGRPFAVRDAMTKSLDMIAPLVLR